MEDIRTEFVPDDNREMLIKHWELRLSDSLQAVYVAQRQLEALYKQRYREIGHLALEEPEKGAKLSNNPDSATA